MKHYKTLLSSAPAHSILNAQRFHYRSSVETDIRKTFARIRREREHAAVIVNITKQVRSLTTTKLCDASMPRRSLQSTAR